MLQQTQVSRVQEKYPQFIKRFPTAQTLKDASVKDVLLVWQGLGYNRRALYLKKACEEVCLKYKGIFPKDIHALMKLPGIGPATAGDMLAFAWNIPHPVIETNIRSVYTHFFFKDKTNVHDKDILPLIEKTLDYTNPREWYWALFDYGAYIKGQEKNNHKSAHYTKQSRFKGSNREKRSEILKLLLIKPQSIDTLSQTLGYEKNMIEKNLLAMMREGLIQKQKNKFTVA
jgi:A/G-specific adenine glycosylase